MQKTDESKTAFENMAEFDEWELEKLTQTLHFWIHIFNNFFFKDQPVSPLPIFFKNQNLALGGRIIGQGDFRSKKGSGRVRLRRPLWQTLVSVTHEMAHAWQARYGKPSDSWYHNNEFRCKMLECGIGCDKSGFNYGVSKPFVSVLNAHGIFLNRPPDSDGFIKIPPPNRPMGKSKLKKWSCGCTNVRVAVKDFQAKCIRCGNEFERILP